MENLSRRTLLETALKLSATLVCSGELAGQLALRWIERRDMFPEGVASGDPDHHSVLLWTRRPPVPHVEVSFLHVEVAEDEQFLHVISRATARISAAADWTCRVLATGLQPSRVYWYRFMDSAGNGSRVGRTITAPPPTSHTPVRFAFVSCQNVNQGAQNAYRRMIYEDERAAQAERLCFVLHLGDFIYEMVWYPEDRPQGIYDRRLRDVVRYPHGVRIGDFHIPSTLTDYRAVYAAYLHDPDIQDARARWPFIPMWDNHEFSSAGWQSFQKFNGITTPNQTRKVAANQAFFEYQPARLVKSSGVRLDEFGPPHVADMPITSFNAQGLGTESNNLTALASLQGYRSSRWGANVELLITDQRSYRSADPTDFPEADAFNSADYPEFVPEEATEILDGGRDYDNGHPPTTIAFGDKSIPNFARTLPRQTVLGARQKEWFLKHLSASAATWKIWGNTTGTLDMRADPLNLPAGLTRPWPGQGYASFGGGDSSTVFMERSEIYDHVERHGITGFATIAGDRHSFWAGLAAKHLPPRDFTAVGVAFITGSISAPGLAEALEHKLPKSHPLRPLFVTQGANDDKPQPAINMLLRHGVRSCLEYHRSGDVERARALSNPEMSPHLNFVDMAGHGYSIVHATTTSLEVEFVCIPRPLERADREDGGLVLYRVRHSTQAWKPRERPHLSTVVLEGDPKLSL